MQFFFEPEKANTDSQACVWGGGGEERGEILTWNLSKHVVIAIDLPPQAFNLYVRAYVQVLHKFAQRSYNTENH
jgi:hypothetical protein